MQRTGIAAANAGRLSSDIARACREKTVPSPFIDDPHPEQSFHPLPPLPLLATRSFMLIIIVIIIIIIIVLLCYSSRGCPESGEALRATSMTSQVCM